MMINNAYSSNPYNNIQNTNQMQNIQPAGDTAQPDRLNKNEDMASETGVLQQSGTTLATNQASEVSITQEARMQVLAAQETLGAGVTETPQTTPYGYGQTGTQNTRQAVETGQIINLTG